MMLMMMMMDDDVNDDDDDDDEELAQGDSTTKICQKPLGFVTRGCGET